MKQDLDSLMEAAGLDALLVTGSATHNPAMFYFTGNVHVNHADLFKLRGQSPVLFCNPMEREEAARTGMAIRNLAEYRYSELLKAHGGDPVKATAERYQKIFTDLGLTKGRVSIYGKINAAESFEVFNALQALMPEIKIVGEMKDPVIMLARETKDAEELDRTRRIGAVTAEVVGNTADFLTAHKAKDGVLVKADGQPLTIGDVKRKINLWAIERGVENPHGVIFAIGRDAGVPHSSGNPDDVLALGQTIVFDIFLQEPGGGYHYDFTRTWCLGSAPEKEQALYDDVREVFDRLMNEELEANMSFKALQDRTCELFEEQGHATTRQDPLIEEGYVHSIGHGLGLDIHELPFARSEESILKPGVIVTIEPGLYYPSQGMGCRIEDTVYIHEDGSIEVLADFPHDLVLEIESE